MAPSIATNTSVELDELLDFVRPRHHMVLITSRADGSPQASPVSGGVDDSGRIVIATYPQRAKTKNARKRPRVSVMVLSDDWDDYRRAMVEQGKSLLRITPTRWSTVSTGGFPPEVAARP
jgi:hypothetical protein